MGTPVMKAAGESPIDLQMEPPGGFHRGNHL